MPVNTSTTRIKRFTRRLTGVALVAAATHGVANDDNEPSLALLEYLGTFTTPEGEYVDPVELEQMAQAKQEENASQQTEPTNSEEDE